MQTRTHMRSRADGHCACRGARVHGAAPQSSRGARQRTGRLDLDVTRRRGREAMRTSGCGEVLISSDIGESQCLLTRLTRQDESETYLQSLTKRERLATSGR
eukprot:2226933-Pleurochrysis_carterae.AAC.2